MVLQNNETFEAWNTVFFITAAVSLTGAIVFFFWGTAEVQKWASNDDEATILVSEDENQKRHHSD